MAQSTGQPSLHIVVGNAMMPQRLLNFNEKSYIPICDYWIITNNSTPNLELITEGNYKDVYRIENNRTFELINQFGERYEKYL